MKNNIKEYVKASGVIMKRVGILVGVKLLMLFFAMLMFINIAWLNVIIGILVTAAECVLFFFLAKGQARDEFKHIRINKSTYPDGAPLSKKARETSVVKAVVIAAVLVLFYSVFIVLGAVLPKGNGGAKGAAELYNYEFYICGLDDRLLQFDGDENITLRPNGGPDYLYGDGNVSFADGIKLTYSGDENGDNTGYGVSFGSFNSLNNNLGIDDWSKETVAFYAFNPNPFDLCVSIVYREKDKGGMITPVTLKAAGDWTAANGWTAVELPFGDFELTDKSERIFYFKVWIENTGGARNVFQGIMKLGFCGITMLCSGFNLSNTLLANGGVFFAFYFIGAVLVAAAYFIGYFLSARLRMKQHKEIQDEIRMLDGLARKKK